MRAPFDAGKLLGMQTLMTIVTIGLAVFIVAAALWATAIAPFRVPRL